MSARTRSHTPVPPEQMGDDDRPQVSRVTFGLIPKALTALLRLMTSTGLNRTDVINRAIQVYDLVDQNTGDGYEMVFRDLKTGHERVIEILH